MPASAAERKRLQRELDAQEGICEVCVRVPRSRSGEIRLLAAKIMKEEKSKAGGAISTASLGR